MSDSDEIQTLRARLVEVEAIANEPCANCGFPTEDAIGKPKLAERLVEVERELTQARVVLGETELARRVAEGAARSLRDTLARCAEVAHKDVPHLGMRIVAIAEAALSGLPPLASEAAGPEAALRKARKEEGYAVGVVGGAVKEPRPALEAIAAGLREKVAQEEARRPAQPTPAALVPKDAATPKAIAGEHKEEGRDG